VVRDFSVTVPPGTPAGEYVTSVILENAAPIKGRGRVALDQVVRQAIAVAVRVPGPLRPGLAVGAASHSVVAERSVVAVEVSNTGNQRLAPAAKLVLRDETGAVVSRATVVMGSFYAGTSTKVEMTLARPLAPGRYRVDVTLDDEARSARAAARGLPLTVVDATTEVATGSAPSVGRQVVDALQPGSLRIWLIALVALPAALAAVGLVAVRLRSTRSHRRPTHGRRRAAHPPVQREHIQVAAPTTEAAAAVSVLPGVATRQLSRHDVRRRTQGRRRAPKHRASRKVPVGAAS
jgi:hypothetical protein